MVHRFFAPPENISSSSISLDVDESHHLTRVLRLGAGVIVRVFDGAGREYECQVRVAARSGVELAIISEVVEPVESRLRVTLAQALVKNDKFDLVTQKATELGVSRIVPLLTAHSEVVRSEERGEKRTKRWERISLEALKQCGRRQLVEITQPQSWEEYCLTDSSEVRLILSERGGRMLASITAETARSPRSVSLAVGPEGGWDEKELELGCAKGWLPVHLGPRILRTETAGIVGAALVQFLFGDLGGSSR